MKAKIVLAGLAALALIGGTALAIMLPGLIADAPVAAGFGARIACSCHYVGGRPLDSCKADFEPGMEWLLISNDIQARTVTARLPLLAQRTARYDPGFGCTLLSQ
jgi:hypothetical protein